MIPAIGPSKLEYPTSQPKMYAWASLSSFQGIISTPMTPVIMPPVRKEMRHGLKFEKSFEGDTTLAATLSAVEPVEEEVFVISMSRQRLPNVRAGIRDVKDLAECPCRELH